MVVAHAKLNLPPFTVEVRDASLAGAGLSAGDVVWVDPRQTARPGDIVLARTRARQRWRLRVCRLFAGPLGQTYLASQPASGRAPMIFTGTFEVIGPVRCTITELHRSSPYTSVFVTKVARAR